MIKRILAIVIGFVTAVILIFVMQLVGLALFPMPEKMETVPVGAKLFELLAYVAGSFGGGLVVGIVVPGLWRRYALILGGILTFLGVLYLMLLPSPIWFSVLTVVAFVPFVWFGAKIVADKD